MQSNVPKVSEEARKAWNEEIAQKMQQKLQRRSRRDDWAERLEAAAHEGFKEAELLYAGANSAREAVAEPKPKAKAKHKDKDKDKEKSKKKKKRDRDRSRLEGGVKKSSKRSKSPNSPNRIQETSSHALQMDLKEPNHM